ncbi:hypothetical protein AC783_04495 [Helicobacter pylori]|nr:hypothetical protein N205_07385 [Helicobacter pylori UM077]KMZ46396.1 hypothetical protein AC783_04495 [Helicobacter pylori]
MKDWAYSFFFTSCFCLILTSTTFHKTLALSLDIIFILGFGRLVSFVRPISYALVLNKNGGLSQNE